MSPWSHLPNAVHIDRILKLSRDHVDIWNAAWETTLTATWGKSWYAARHAAWDKAYAAAYYAARHAAWAAARNIVWDNILKEESRANRDAIAALIAWDDSAQFLDMTSDELEVWARLSNNPAAILMLPAVKALEQIKSLETV